MTMGGLRWLKAEFEAYLATYKLHDHRQVTLPRAVSTFVKWRQSYQTQPVLLING